MKDNINLAVLRAMIEAPRFRKPPNLMKHYLEGKKQRKKDVVLRNEILEAEIEEAKLKIKKADLVIQLNRKKELEKALYRPF